MIGKMEERTERESKRRRSEMIDLLVLPRSAESLQNGADFSAKFQHTGPAEKKRVATVPQSEQLAKTPEAAFAKIKENRVISRDHQIVRWERESR